MAIHWIYFFVKKKRLELLGNYRRSPAKKFFSKIVWLLPVSEACLIEMYHKTMIVMHSMPTRWLHCLLFCSKILFSTSLQIKQWKKKKHMKMLHGNDEFHIGKHMSMEWTMIYNELVTMDVMIGIYKMLASSAHSTIMVLILNFMLTRFALHSIGHFTLNFSNLRFTITFQLIQVAHNHMDLQ